MARVCCGTFLVDEDHSCCPSHVIVPSDSFSKGGSSLIVADDQVLTIIRPNNNELSGYSNVTLAFSFGGGAGTSATLSNDDNIENLFKIEHENLHEI